MSQHLKIVMADGTVEERSMGNMLDQEQAVGFTAKAVYGDGENQPMIRREDWRPFTTPDKFVPQIIDQDGVGKCNASTAVQALMTLRAMKGYSPTNLSDDYLYARINGGRDQGSILEDALRVLCKEGTCRKETWPDLEWRLGRGPKDKAAAESPKHRILEYFLCPTVDHVVSAVLSGFCVDTGLWWHDRDPLDGDGWMTLRPGGNRGGHAVMRCSLHERNGQWGLGGPNSWGTRYGKNGYMVVPLERYDRQMSVGMWAVREVVALDEPLPPIGG